MHASPGGVCFTASPHREVSPRAWAKNRRRAAWTLVQFSRALADNGYGRDPSGATQGRNKILTGIVVRPWKTPTNAPDGGGTAKDQTISQIADERRARRKQQRSGRQPT